MRLRDRLLSTRHVTEALSYLPPYHKDLVRRSIEIYNTVKVNRHGQKVEGSFSERSGKIFLYAFDKQEISHKRYLSTIWHEVGHAVFDAILDRVERVDWQKVREGEPFLIDLSDLYAHKELWEEEFCFTYQMLARLNFYRRNRMKKKIKKMEKILDYIPKRRDFVKSTFKKAASFKPKTSLSSDCLKEAQDRLEKIIGPLI